MYKDDIVNFVSESGFFLLGQFCAMAKPACEL